GAIAPEFPDVAMDLAGTPFCNHIDHIARTPAVLSGEGIGLNSHFLGLVDPRNPNHCVPIVGIVPVPVEQEGGSAKVAAAEIHKADVAVLYSSGAAPTEHLHLCAVVGHR